MNLKNYTSTVPMVNSIQRIEHRLAQVGATFITKEYDPARPGVPIGMVFQININGNPVNFKVPAKAERVYKYMVKQRSKPPTNPQLEKIRDQANRTAWKILSDWIDLQVSLIEVDQMDFVEAFLPGSFNPRTGETLYDEIKAANYSKLLTD